MSTNTMKLRHKIIPASYLYLKQGNKVLLLRRFNTGYEDGNYSMPAGHVEEGETFMQCLIRETYEEIGICIKKEDLHLLHVLEKKVGEEGNNHKIDLFFTATRWNGTPVIKEPQKSDDLQWFNLRALPSNIVPHVKQAITMIQQGIFYSKYGWNF